jgi:outer membrane protein OmpA-like peptidoglycan-associated protein
MKRISALLLCSIPAMAFAQQQQTVVYFDYNKYELTAAATHTLDSIAAISSGPVSIELKGYCDKIGNDVYNDKLSLQRTTAVKQYLLQKGIIETAFSGEKGFGKRKPVNDNATDEERLLNRRVEISYVVNPPLPEEKTVVETKQEVPRDSASLTYMVEKKMKDSLSIQPAQIVLKNLNFIGGRHVVIPGSVPVLQELLVVMQKYPGLKIEIQGHICCVFEKSDGYDFDTRTWNLSVNRAKTVYDYLVDNGIDVSRLSYKGMAATQPLFYPEKDEIEKQANRRVEIKIISK